MGATEITVIHGNHKVVDLNPFKTLSSTIKALLWTQVYEVIGFLQKRVSKSLQISTGTTRILLENMVQ